MKGPWIGVKGRRIEVKRPAIGVKGGCTSPTDLTGAGATVTFDWLSINSAATCIKIHSSQSVSFTNVGTGQGVKLDCGTGGTSTGTGAALAIEVVP